MAIKKAGAKPLAAKKATSGRKAAARSGSKEPRVLKLPLVGKIKRADIRKAVQAVFREKAAYISPAAR
jgi:hypothetical protein